MQTVKNAEGTNAPLIVSFISYFICLLVNVGTLQETCALNCLEKYLKMNQRISQRFQEYQMIVNETAIAAAQKLAAK